VLVTLETHETQDEVCNMLSSASFNALSLSQATSGYSEEVDLEVIDEIIERAPREATTFPLVYRAYLQVLQEQ
jgi:protein SFI1